MEFYNVIEQKKAGLGAGLELEFRAGHLQDTLAFFRYSPDYATTDQNIVVKKHFEWEFCVWKNSVLKIAYDALYLLFF